MSPRAAARLESLGFENVCDYKAGKQDWLASGLPVEGHLAHVATIGQIAQRDVPSCRFDESLSDVQERVARSGWDECVVTDEAGVVLGLVRKTTWEQATGETTLEQIMDPGPATFRPHVPLEEMSASMEKRRASSVLVTTSEGKLIGAIRRQDIEKNTSASAAQIPS